MKQFYEIVEKAYDKNKITKGYQIINIDETGLTIGSKGEISIEKKGKTRTVVTENGKKHVTIIGCSDAMGHYFAPLFIFQAKKSINADVLQFASEETTVSVQNWVGLTKISFSHDSRRLSLNYLQLVQFSAFLTVIYHTFILLS